MHPDQRQPNIQSFNSDSITHLNMQGQPQNMQEQPQNMQGQPQNMQEQPQNMQEQPQNMQEQPQNMQGQPQNMPGQPPSVLLTSKQMMRQSTSFKLCFTGAILCAMVSIVLKIVGTDTVAYYSCDYYYSSYTNRCYDGYNYYCCKSGYSNCGGIGCLSNPVYYERD